MRARKTSTIRAPLQIGVAIVPLFLPLSLTLPFRVAGDPMTSPSLPCLPSVPLSPALLGLQDVARHDLARNWPRIPAITLERHNLTAKRSVPFTLTAASTHNAATSGQSPAAALMGNTRAPSQFSTAKTTTRVVSP